MASYAPMRVSYVSTYPPIHCGVGEYTRFLLTSVSGISPGGSYYVLAEEGVSEGYVDESSGARVIPAFRSRDPASYKGILAALEEIGGVDVLHVQHEYGIFGASKELLEVVAEAKARGLAAAAVITLHTVVHPMAANRYEGDVISFQEGLPHYFDEVIVHSAAQEFELHAQGLPYSAIERIPHGTMVNPYIDAPRRIMAAKLGLGEEILEHPLLALMGFLKPNKGLDTLAEAISMLDDLDFRVIIGGEVKDEGVRRHLESIGDDRLVFIERYLSADEILMIAALADTLVLPYRDAPGAYSVSGILHLSMGSLKPIIGTRAPRLMELYTNAPQLTVRQASPEELAEKIRWVIRNYDLAVAYAGPLYSYAARTNWRRMARRHLALYRRVLRRARQAPWHPRS